MRKIYLYTTLIISFLTTALFAAPRLTVVAVVDGLTTENLTLLRPFWQQGGLRTLSEEAFQTGVAYPVYGGNETTATLVTGVTPDRHGYTMDNWFSRRDRRSHAMLEDESVRGIGTSLQLSAKALLSQTMTDKMRLQYPNAKIYAIGIHPETTVLLAGHAANACCWIDPQTREWVATAAYSEGLPTAAFEQNKNGRIAALAERQWTPRMDIPTYTSPTEKERKKGFAYSVAEVLTEAPEANTLVIELALAIQQAEKLGLDATPDILMLQLNTISPAATSDYIASAEHEDMYLRLNQDLGFLMEQLDRRIGRTNYQILVVGRPIVGIDAQRLSDIQMPDRTLIEQKRLSLETIQRQVANFLMDFEGIQTAMPAYEASRYPILGASLCKRHTGDVVFLLQPGWQLMQDEQHTIDRVIEDNPVSPVLLWSGTIRPMPQGTLDATDIANLIFP